MTPFSRLRKPPGKDCVGDSTWVTLVVIYSALAGLEATSVNKVRRPPLDEIDHEILRLLAADGRMANLALASAVGIAPSTCLGRVRALRESGIIRGYHADIDLSAVGLPIQAIIAVRLQAHHRDQIQAFVTVAPHLPGVVEVFHVAGGRTTCCMWRPLTRPRCTTSSSSTSLPARPSSMPRRAWCSGTCEAPTCCRRPDVRRWPSGATGAGRAARP